jgi:hypothetical protein
MPTFIALLRGINAGKAKRVPMAELRALLSGLGSGAVRDRQEGRVGHHEKLGYCRQAAGPGK